MSADRLGRAGFSLIEILIVMTLLVTLTAILTPMMLPSPARTLRAAASDIATTLRETGRRARADQRRRRFVIDTDSGRFGIQDSATRRTLPSDVDSEVTTAESLLTGESAAIDFFPDGSSTGGRVVLTLEDRSFQVDVEWLTGRIRVSEATP